MSSRSHNLFPSVCLTLWPNNLSISPSDQLVCLSELKGVKICVKLSLKALSQPSLSFICQLFLRTLDS